MIINYWKYLWTSNLIELILHIKIFFFCMRNTPIWNQSFVYIDNTIPIWIYFNCLVKNKLMWQLNGVPTKLPVVDETSLHSEWWGLCLHFLQDIGKGANFLFWQLFTFSICIVQFSMPIPLTYTHPEKSIFYADLLHVNKQY